MKIADKDLPRFISMVVKLIQDEKQQFLATESEEGDEIEIPRIPLDLTEATDEQLLAYKQASARPKSAKTQQNKHTLSLTVPS